MIFYGCPKHKQRRKVEVAAQQQQNHHLSLPPANDCAIKSNGDISRVYGTNPLEALSPLIINDPTYGSGHVQEGNSFFEMQPQGKIDELFFQKYLH